MNSLLKPPFTDNEPTLDLGENPKSLTSLAELVLKQGSEELNEYSGVSTGKQESCKQSSTCKYDYQKGLLKGQSSSTHSVTMGSLLPLKGQDLLKLETISQPDIPKQSSTCKHDYRKRLLERQLSSTHSLTMDSLLPLKGQEILKRETISQPDIPKQSSTCKFDYQKGESQFSSTHSLTMDSLLLLKGQEILIHETISQPDIPKPSSTCKHDYRKGERQFSSTHSLTMDALLPLKGQEILKHETISQPDIPKMSTLKDILMLRRTLHIRYLSLAITTYKYSGSLTSDVSIEYDSINNKFTVVSSYEHSWLLEPLQRDLKNLSEQPELKVTETEIIRDVVERTNYYAMSRDLELGSLKEVVLLNYMSIMKIRKWKQRTRFHSFNIFERLYLDISMEKKIHEVFVDDHGLEKETRHVYKHFPIDIHYLIHMIIQDFEGDGSFGFQHERIKHILFRYVMTSNANLENLKAAQLMFLLLDQISIKKFICTSPVHNYLEFMEVLHS